MKIKTVIIGIFIILIIFFGVLVLTFVLKPDIGKFTPLETPGKGKFASLEHGDVYYEIAGPENGPLVMMVHGSIVYSISWDKNFYALAKAGFRVLRFDLYGRGNSSRPTIAYTESLYLNQMRQLLKHVQFSKDVHLIGLSMGGALVTIFAQKYPHMVRSVSLVDPVGPHFWEADGQKLFKRFIERIQKRVRKKTEVQEKRMEIIRPLLSKMREQFKYKGVGRSILSGIRHLKDIDLTAAYKDLGESKLPTLLIWGEFDDVIPVSESKNVIEFVPQVQYHTIKGAGHLVHYEKPEEVNNLFISFISKNS